MLIAFWSPYHGQTGTTTTALTMASMVAITNNHKVLIGHSHFQPSTLENYLLQKRQGGEDSLSFSDQGIDALIRLAKNGRLKPEMISDYTTPLLASNRLDLLQGSMGLTNHESAEQVQVLRQIFSNANKAYDLVMVDVHSGMNQDLTKKILEDSDLVVVCLNQNLCLLEDYFGHSGDRPSLMNKKVLYHLSSYNKDSKYTMKNIKRLFALDKIIATPYSIELMDACNSGGALDFYMRHLNGGKKDRFYPMMKALRTSVETFLEAMSQLDEEATVA